MGKAARNPDTDPLPDSDKLTFGDQIQSRVQPTMMQTDSATGEVYNPRRRWMQNRIQFRKDEEAATAQK